MSEFDEFAEALFSQLSVEINEEHDIIETSVKADEELTDKVKFRDLEDITSNIIETFKAEIEHTFGVQTKQDLTIKYLELDELKRLKRDKVFAAPNAKEFVTRLFDAVISEDRNTIAELMKEDTAKYLVYSTYAIQYISKLTTTYGDYLNSTIYLNKFILSRYPQIILYKQGEPYITRFDDVNSGYIGAVKMTVLEELVHSTQENLNTINKNAAIKVNMINEELAKIILSLDSSTIDMLTEYCQLQAVPDDFPFAKRANLFFFLNPDHFLIEQIGPDVMTFTHVEIDPKIEEAIPQLLDIYKRWLEPIQQHHAAFTSMEGMAAFAVERILYDDPDFARYLSTFMGTDFSSYQIRKNMGKDFVAAIHAELGIESFSKIIQIPPTTLELKEPQLYIQRLRQ